MTPINQGMYEFKNDSLIEIRKRMGISQSKMAEMLKVPANTLSRWETGATGPDANSLAAIYSLAREQLGTEIPPFFGVRSIPLEVNLSSKSPDQSVDSLSFYHLLRGYLNTRIELTGTVLAPVIEVEIKNMAPVDPIWPKVVFTGVGLSLAHAGGTSINIQSPRLRKRRNDSPVVTQGSNAESPWQHDEKRERLLKVAYQRVDNREFPDLTSDEGTHGEVLLPGQSVVYEMDVTQESLPYIQFKVEGTVSRRHLFHCEETFTMPETFTKPLLINAFNDYKAIKIHEPLEAILNLMPKFDSSTRLEEVHILSKAVSEAIAKIKTIQHDINEVFYHHNIASVRAHIRATFIYLDRVTAALARMKEAIESNSPDNIIVAVTSILALKGESAQLDRETKELMLKFNVSDEDMK